MGSSFMKKFTETTHDHQPYPSERLAAIGLAAAALAHEIANELNVVRCAVQVAKEELTKQDEEKDDVVSALDEARNGIERLSSLLQQFRNLARPQKLRLQPTDLAHVVEELLAVEKVRYAARGIHVELSLSRNLPRIMVDVEKIRRALLNLCTNAADAMPGGGTLKLRGYSSNSSVSLEVIDTGVGIPAGLDIFGLFTTTKPQGTGLGLPIVREIVSAHGGTVTYTSQPGTETVFRLTLPVHRGAISQAAAE